jgi:ATP:corrinoid adenosyltransferase
MFATVVNVENSKINEKKEEKKSVVEYLFVLSFQDVLTVLRSLCALICLEEIVVFLYYGYLSMDNVVAMRKEVTKLCSKLWHSPFKWINTNA